MKPRAILATALLLVVAVVAIIMEWILWRPGVSGASMPIQSPSMKFFLVEGGRSFL
jgi:hypothetical protein